MSADAGWTLEDLGRLVIISICHPERSEGTKVLGKMVLTPLAIA